MAVISGSITSRRPVEEVFDFVADERNEPIYNPQMRMVEFAPDAGGTRMSWSWDLRPKGVLKLASPLFAAAGRRQEQRIWSGLKAYLERSSPA